MTDLIEWLEQALVQLDKADEHIAALKLDECITILTERYGVSRNMES